MNNDLFYHDMRNVYDVTRHLPIQGLSQSP